MIYFLETELNKKKSLKHALINLYGIGKFQNNFFCKKLGISENFKVYDLSNEQTNELLIIIKNSKLVITTELKKVNVLLLKKLISIKAFKGLRKLKGFPVRGQRTHTNAKTSKYVK